MLVFGFVELTQISRRPDARSRYHVYVGLRHSERGETVESLAAFERGLAIEPDSAPLANEVAYSLALAGRELDRADELVDLALAGDPENANYIDTKGWIACRAGDADAGLELLREAAGAGTSADEEVQQHLETCVDAAVAR